jgi:hypothetical protein
VHRGASVTAVTADHAWPPRNANSAVMDRPLHPIYERLLMPAEPFTRHALLHDMEMQLSRIRDRCPGLHARVHSFVDRGVPYFAPADSRYREWAAKASQLWDELQRRDRVAAEASAV